LGILTRFHSRQMMAQGTTRHRAENGVVMRVVASDGADDGAPETAFASA
jgi:hypothetical protein